MYVCTCMYVYVYMHVEDKRKVYTEQEATDIAYASSGTVLWTNKCDLYENKPGGPHAEVLMIQDNSLPYTITDIKIKNSPCYECSQRLINYYRYYSNKPTIWIGQIWHMNDYDDDNGLLNLMREGFTIKVWNMLHFKMHGYSRVTTSYLCNIYLCTHNRL